MLHSDLRPTDNHAALLLAVLLAASVFVQTLTVKALGAPAADLSVPGVTGRNYGECMVRGKTFLSQPSYQSAADEYRQAIKFNAGDPLAHYGLGLSLKGLGLEDEALYELFEALRCQPDFLDARFEIGTIFMKRESWDEAGGQFLQILHARPNDLATRGNLGLCFLQKNQLDKAIQQFKYIVETDPKNIEGHYNLACALDLQKDYDLAAAEYRRIIQIDPRHPMAYVRLGTCLMSKGDMKSAIVLEKRAIQLFPDNHHAYIALGRAYELMGSKEATECYKKAIQLAPQDPACKKVLANMMKTSAKKFGLANIPGLN